MKVLSNLFTKSYKLNKESIIKILLFLIILFGFSIRLFLYLIHRPLWLDECSLALNITDLSNYFVHLLYHQSAPAFFLYLSKFFYVIIPDKEFALRLLPFIYSVLSIFLFYIFSRKIFKSVITSLISLSIFVSSYQLIYYSQEFKQYSGDVFWFLLILYSYFILINADSRYKYTLLSILYSVAIYFSFTSFIAEFCIFLVLLIFDRNKFKKFVLYFIPIILVTLIYYFSYVRGVDREHFNYHWEIGFFSNNLALNINIIKEYYIYIYNTYIPALFSLLSLFLLLKYNRKNQTTYLLLFPIIFAFILSYLKFYPFSQRVALYISSLIIIISVYFIDYLLSYKFQKKIYCYIVILLYCIVTLIPIFQFDYKKITNLYIEDIITPLHLIKNMSNENDTVIICTGTNDMYLYYSKFIPIKNKVIIHSKSYDEKKYIKKLKSYPKGKVYYWVLAHNLYKNQRFNTVYNWARNKEDFYCYRDKSNNALIRYKL